MERERPTGSVITGKFFTLASGIEVHFHDLGDPAGEVVLFLHGAAPGASSLANYGSNYEAFLDAGFRLLMPDLVGFGASSKPVGQTYDVAFLSEPVVELLDALEVEACRVVGNSFGGAVANYLAIHHPKRVSRMVLAAPHCLERPEIYNAMPGVRVMRDVFSADSPTLKDIEAAFQVMVADPIHVTPDLLASRVAVMSEQPPEVMRSLVFSDMSGDVERIVAPTMVFWGAHDQITPVSGGLKMIEKCLSADLVIMNGVGHWPQTERAGDFNRLAIEFLLRVS